MYNILISGAAGQGIETTADILNKTLKRTGYFVYTVKDFMSRVRGGHNFTSIRFGNEPIHSHSQTYDVIVALNEESVEIHKDELTEQGIIICDQAFKVDVPHMYKIPITELAKTAGSVRTSGSVAVGAILKLFGLDGTIIEEVLKEQMKAELVDMNVKAVKAGLTCIEQKFSLEKGTFKDWLVLSGSEAVGLGAIAAGLKFYSAYPMSPSTAVMEYIASVAAQTSIVVEQAEDEIAGINMALGASYAGARAMTGTSGGGFSLKVEALGFAGMAEIPLVVINVMRPGPATGLPTRTEQSDLKFVISASQGEFPRMVIALRDQEDAFYQTFRAFQMAEKYQIPVIILSDQYIGDNIATVKPFDLTNLTHIYPDTSSDQEEYLRYKITESGISKRLIPGKVKEFVNVDSDEHDERGWIVESAEERVAMMDKRMRKLEGLKKELMEPESYGADTPEILFIGWGSTSGPIKEAVDSLNRRGKERFGALLFGDVYPLPTEKLMNYAKTAKKIIDVEQNKTAQFADLVREGTGIVVDERITKYDGRQITGEEIMKQVIA